MGLAELGGQGCLSLKEGWGLLLLLREPELKGPSRRLKVWREEGES